MNTLTEDMMYEDGSSYFTTKDMEAEYDPTDDDDPDDDYDPSIFCTKATEDVVDTETTEDMMYPDGSTHFITEDMEAEYDHIDVSCKDCPDDECTGHCMSCCYR